MTELHYVPGRRLGLGQALTDARTLQAETYFTPRLPAPPTALTRSIGVTLDMYANDQIGDCGVAAPANYTRVVSFTDQRVQQNIPLGDVLTAYSALSGFDPVTGANDDGVVLLRMLRYWRSIGIGGHRIGAFASVDPDSQRETEQAVSLFGGVIVGASLPKAAAMQNSEGQTWTPTRGRDGKPGSWGRHAMVVIDYDPTGVTFGTWGQLQRATWPWYFQCVDESYAVVSPDWLGPDGKSPAGLNAAQLAADLRAI